MGNASAESRTSTDRALTLALSIFVLGLLLGARSGAVAHGARANECTVDENTVSTSSSVPSSQASHPDIPAPKYSLFEIPGLADVRNGDRLALNASGDVAGVHQRQFLGQAAFFYHRGKVTDLLPGGDPSGYTDGYTEFVAMNDLGQVLITRSEMVGREDINQPYIWQAGHFIPVGPAPKDLKDLLHERVPHSWPVSSMQTSALNNAGQVAGYFVRQENESDSPDHTKAFLWQSGVFQILTYKAPTATARRQSLSRSRKMTPHPDFAQRSFLDFKATAMNNNGQVLGVYSTISPFASGPHRVRVVIWKNGNERIFEIRSKYDKAFGRSDANTAPIEYSDVLSPVAINDLGQWVGVHDFNLDKAPGDVSRACFWSDGDQGHVQDLALPHATHTAQGLWESDKLQSQPYAINNKSQIVGKVIDARGQETACLWQEGKAYDLNDLIDKSLAIRLDIAHAINKAGQIVATGWRDQNKNDYHVYILTPIKQ